MKLKAMLKNGEVLRQSCDGRILSIRPDFENDRILITVNNEETAVNIPDFKRAVSLISLLMGETPATEGSYNRSLFDAYYEGLENALETESTVSRESDNIDGQVAAADEIPPEAALPAEEVLSDSKENPPEDPSLPDSGETPPDSKVNKNRARIMTAKLVSDIKAISPGKSFGMIQTDKGKKFALIFKDLVPPLEKDKMCKIEFEVVNKQAIFKAML